jgi:hypothetical protein
VEANTAHKKIQITIETERVLMIRRSVNTRLWCQKCGGEVDVVDLIQAEILTGIAPPVFPACAEAKQWHSFEGPDGTTFVCLESVLKSM